MTADQVFLTLGIARPDVADLTIASAVHSAVVRNLELLAEEGWLVRAGEAYRLVDDSFFERA